MPLRKPSAKLPAGGGEPRSREVACYPYEDENGTVLSQVVRFDPKDFRQFRIDANGQRIWKGGMGDTRRVIYRLPEVLAADEVFV